MDRTDRKLRSGGPTSPTQAKTKHPVPEQGIDTEQQSDQQEHPINDKQEDSTMDEDPNPSQKQLRDNLDPKTILIKQDKYYAYAPADGIKLFHKKKTRKVHQLLMDKVGFINISLKKIKKQLVFKVLFENKQSFDEFLKITYQLVVEDEQGKETDRVPLKFESMETMRPAKTDEEKNDEKERTIQVFDIALYVKEKDIKDAFKLEGDIEKIYTKQVSIYQQAYITYARKECTEKFYKVWSYHVKQNMVRVIPILLNKENH